MTLMNFKWTLIETLNDNLMYWQPSALDGFEYRKKYQSGQKHENRNDGKSKRNIYHLAPIIVKIFYTNKWTITVSLNGSGQVLQ